MDSRPTDRFAKLKELFLALSELPPAERARRLDALGTSDPALRADLESLLSQDSMSFDVASAQDFEGLFRSLQSDSPAPSEHPERIGPYRILGVLGTGGMGVVYRAVQLEPIRREVALKVVHRGLDSRQVMNRFESERQTLAMMDHPNIAKVLDAGSDQQGNPYFVMELVPGVPITEYAQSAQLSIPQRLALFRSVCRAAHHAHMKGIIHRDLKPSNILVSTHDGAPVPKIIDFGIAKATEVADPASTLTREGHLLGTLEYMSPEQAAGTPGGVDTRSDVYSLGVILYELLTGSLPYDLRGLSLIDAVRAIESAQPRTLRSTAQYRRRFDADLETIVGKALEKAADRRYGSAAGLGEDVDRFLRSQPILARPPSSLYQLRKLARRHRTGVALAATVLVLLVAFGVGMSIEAAAQRRERDRAEAEARKATRISEFLQNMLGSANPSVKNVDVRVRDVLDDAVHEADFSLSEDPELDAAVRRTIGNTYLTLGLFDKADLQLRRALDLRRRIPSGDPALVAQALSDLASCLASRNIDVADFAAADTMTRQALEIRTDLWGEEHPEVAASLYQLAELRRKQDRVSEADSLHTCALIMREKLLGKTHHDVAQSLRSLAELRSDAEQGEAFMRRALDIDMANHSGDHPDVASAMSGLASLLYRSGKQTEAESLHVHVLAMERRLWGARHPRVAEAMDALGQAYTEQSRFAEAEPLLREALEIRVDFHGANSTSAAIGHSDLGWFLWLKGDLQEAEMNHRKAVSILREKAPGNDLLAHALNNSAMVLSALGKDDEAVEAQEESAQLFERIWGSGHRNTAMINNNLGVFLLNRARYSEAEPHVRKAFVIWKDVFGEEHPYTAAACGNLAYTLHGLDELDEAETLYREALALHQRVRVRDSWTLNHLLAARNLGECLHHRNRLDESEDVFRETERRFRETFGSEHHAFAGLLSAYGSLLIDRAKYPEAEAALVESDMLIKRGPGILANRALVRNALAACRAAQGRTAEADSLFRVSTPQAWSGKTLPAARRIARARALHFYEAQGRADMVASIRAS